MNDMIYIVGAHSRSRTLGIYLKSLRPELSIKAYLVDNDEPNPDSIDGVPVICFDEDTKLNRDYPVYLATRGVYHQSLAEKFRNMKMRTVIPVTPQLDTELRNKFLAQHFGKLGRNFVKLNHLKSNLNTCVYVIKSVADKPLKNAKDTLPDYKEELQVGAALSRKNISLLRDDQGDNISEKNEQFCELTGLYWIWKHADEDIIGLEHYRRHFILSDNWQEKMVNNDIDVILPTPLYVAPSLAQNYRDRHVSSDWEFMNEYIRGNYRDEYDGMMEFFENTNLYSPCNMFIMRRRALKDYCSWLFPIIFACAEHIGARENSYQNRYPGFLAERLMTYFFEKNKDRYQVVYEDKNFLD